MANPDASTFHEIALRHIAKERYYLGIDYEFYVNLLTFVYRFFGESQLLGNALSVLMFSGTCLLLVSFLDHLYLRPYHRWVLLVFGFIPSGLVLQSMTLRESWELFFLMLSIYCAFNAAASERKTWWMLAMCCAAVILGLLHKALLLYVGFLLPLLFLYTLAQGKVAYNKRVFGAVVATTFLVLAIFGSIILLTESGKNSFIYHLVFGMNKEGDSLIGEILHYRNHVDRMGDPRTAFLVTLDGSSNINAAIGLVKIYFHYLVAAPLDNISNIKDLYAVCEGVLRICLLVASFIAVCRSIPTRAAKSFVLLMVVYLSLTFLWSVGTTNYGQAIRHHVLTNWILVLLGLPCIIGGLERIARTWRPRVL